MKHLKNYVEQRGGLGASARANRRIAPSWHPILQLLAGAVCLFMLLFVIFAFGQAGLGWLPSFSFVGLIFAVIRKHLARIPPFSRTATLILAWVALSISLLSMIVPDTKEQADEIIALGETDTETQSQKLAMASELVLREIEKVAPALGSKERARRQQLEREQAERASTQGEGGQVERANSPRGADWLPEAVRFSEYQPGEDHYRAQEALNDGDVLTAMILFGQRNSIAHPDGPRERRMQEAIQQASDEQLGVNSDEEFAYRVNRYWLTELQTIIEGPIAAGSTGKTLGQLEEAQRRLDDVAGVSFHGPEEQALRTYVAKLRDAQIAAFPKLRDALVGELARRFFRENIEVEASGSRKDQVVFTSFRYTNHANIEDDYVAMRAELERLRFKKATFRMSPHGRSYTYTLETPVDGNVKWETS